MLMRRFEASKPIWQSFVTKLLVSKNKNVKIETLFCP